MNGLGIVSSGAWVQIPLLSPWLVVNGLGILILATAFLGQVLEPLLSNTSVSRSRSIFGSTIIAKKERENCGP